jgi:ElaB/YqjD/DUF883 family membrane-anchored ribosome-binding protein
MTSNSTDRDLSTAGEHIGHSLAQLRGDIAALSETVLRLASEGAASARSQIRDTTDRADRGASAAGEQIYQNAAVLGRGAADRTNIATPQIESQIVRNPLATVFVALGLGFALGVVSWR